MRCLSLFTVLLGTATAVFAQTDDGSTNSTDPATTSTDPTTNAALANSAPDNVGGMNVTQTITEASAAGIALAALNVSADAMSYMNQLASNAPSNDTSTRRRRAVSGTIDVHAHAVFPWYQLLVPSAGGQATPNWSPQAHIAFMASEGISHSVLSVSAPGANVFLGNRLLTAALARLLNINMAAVVACYPNQFSWYAVVPLPNVQDAIAEVDYALDTLGADGIIFYSNYEGIYPGDPQFAAFFQHLNSRTSKTVVFIHPTEPVLPSGSSFRDSNPTVYSSSVVEYYFETTRAIIDLSWTLTLVNNTNVEWIGANIGGSFSALWDRMIKSIPQDIPLLEPVYRSRFFWESSGYTYPNQIKGLLGYNMPPSQLLFGTEYPYAPHSQDYLNNLNNVKNASTSLSGFSATTVSAILSGNAQTIFQF